MIAIARSQERHATLPPDPWTVQTLGDGFMCSDLHFIRRWHRFPQMLAALTYICVHLRNLRIAFPFTSTSGSSGQLASVYHPDAFGNMMASWQTGLWTDSYTTREGWHHNTKEFDGDTGLVYMHQRWYLPETGTFGSRAPYPPMMEHAYIYANSSPIGTVDPDGKMGCNVTTARKEKDKLQPIIDKCKGMGVPACGTKAREQCQCVQDEAKKAGIKPKCWKLEQRDNFVRVPPQPPDTYPWYYAFYYKMHTRCILFSTNWQGDITTDTFFWKNTDMGTGPFTFPHNNPHDPPSPYPWK